jgi:hypothetical protein
MDQPGVIAAFRENLLNAFFLAEALDLSDELDGDACGRGYPLGVGAIASRNGSAKCG